MGNKRRLKSGAYATAISVIVIAILVVMNLLVGRITKSVDLTDRSTYTLSDEMKKYLSGFDTDVTVYYVTEAGKESVLFTNLFENMAMENSHLHLIYKDPVQYPQLIYKYNGLDEDIHSNSIILINEENPDRFAYIDYEEMCIYRTDYDSATMQAKKTLTGFDAEQEMVKGLMSITGGSTQKVYFTTGHGEEKSLLTKDGKVTDVLGNLLALNRAEPAYLATATKASVPEDCSLLVLAGLQTDLTEEEVKLLKDYMAAGGRICAMLHFGTGLLPNLGGFLGEYGIVPEKGVLCEKNPDFTKEETPCYILTKRGSGYCYWPLGSALSVADPARNTITGETLVKTETGYVKAYDANDLTFGEGDVQKTYGMLVKATEKYHNVTSTLYAFNSYLFLSDNCLSDTASYQNAELFLSVLSEGGAAGAELSIPIKQNKEPGLVIPNTQKRVLMILFIGVIPGILIVLGVVVFFRRRN